MIPTKKPTTIAKNMPDAPNQLKGKFSGENVFLSATVYGVTIKKETTLRMPIVIACLLIFLRFAY